MASLADPRLATALDVAGCVRSLARAASLELNHLELREFHATREFLRRGQRIFVSHLPRQSWEQTFEVCAQVVAAGFEAIPHIPVRLLADERHLSQVLGRAVSAGVREPLLLSGDYQKPVGVYSNVLEVLRSGALQAHGVTRVSFAGHPEGHPAVPPQEIRRAQIDKCLLASQQGLEVTLITQFFFDARPFTHWASDLRSAGVGARLVAGLAGPAGITRLLRLATRCGVGPSIRALTARPSAMLSLLSDLEPDALVRELAAEWQRRAGLFHGLHLFSFGGFSRTARWLHQQAD
jgi:methylenetetrahydrofolate reductase (NADPH)